MITLPIVPTSPASIGLAHLKEQTARYVVAGLQGASNTAQAYAGD